MRGKKAKQLRGLAKRFAAMQDLPHTTYEVAGTQIVLGQCQRRMYQTMKAKYYSVGWQ
jgi:hypothetical protein